MPELFIAPRLFFSNIAESFRIFANMKEIKVAAFLIEYQSLTVSNILTDREKTDRVLGVRGSYADGSDPKRVGVGKLL